MSSDDEKAGGRPGTEREPKADDRKGSGRQRLQIDFSAEAFQRLEEIRRLSRAGSKAEVVRNAIRLYEWYLTSVKQRNATLQVVEGNTVKQVELVF